MTKEKNQDYIPPENGVGERIRLKRAEIADGLTVEDLSRVCKEFDPEGKGISRLAISRYEAGKFIPGARELRILCDALGVSPNWLLLGREMEAWPQQTYVMLDAVANWIESLKGRELHDMLQGRPQKNDMVRLERIRKAIAKKMKP